jgi:hypothetical protein
MVLLSDRVRVSRLLLTAGIAALWCVMPPAQAGSATADSIWDRKNALQRAMQAMPAGATVTKQNCQTLEIGLDNTRYRCTVWWSDAPVSPPASQPTPAATP